MNGVLINTISYYLGDGELQTCREVTALNPTARPPNGGCDDCDYSWRVVFQGLQDTCNFRNIEGEQTRDVGVNLEADELRLWSAEENVWVGYAGEGSSEGNTYSGSSATDYLADGCRDTCQ